MRIILLDCDIASCLAKVDRMDLLKRAFPDSEIYITESVYIELWRAKQAGFLYPDIVFESVSVISINHVERTALQEISRNGSIHFGEAEGVVISKNRGAIFLTNDSRVVRYCRDIGIKVLDLKDILLYLILQKSVNQSELKDLIEDIEEKDNTIIKEKLKILSEFKAMGMQGTKR